MLDFRTFVMILKVLVVVLVLEFPRAFSITINTRSFPDDFLFGAASASYQVEGGWNESDKGENIWDYFTHNHPEKISDGSNGDIACNSYHKIQEDVANLKAMGVEVYRFSLSWARILPNGFYNVVSENGLRYYNELIDALIENGIKPLITLYHWDMAVTLQHLGGWVNPFMVDYFKDYADVVFKNFGDRVKLWITFNEPVIFCGGYGAIGLAPGVEADGIGEYLCLHTVLLAHAAAYHLYNDTYRPSQNGSVGVTLSATWYEPNTTMDEAAADRILQFQVGIVAQPIFSSEGDYPLVVKEAVANRSAKEGFPYSRLPAFTSEEVEYIKGTSDFFGLNHYSSYMVADKEADPIGNPSCEYDEQVSTWEESSWETGSFTMTAIVPWGFTKILLWVTEQYGSPIIIITENGYADHGDMEDTKRINYFRLYLSAVLDALDAGANVKGYTAWSLMDSFEWLGGFTRRMGLYYVNMSDPERPRTPKSSVTFFKEVISSRTLTTYNDTTTESVTTMSSAEVTTASAGNTYTLLSASGTLGLIFTVIYVI